MQPHSLLLRASTDAVPGPRTGVLSPILRRRDWLLWTAVALTPLAQAAAPAVVDVWKSPSCGCCGDWIKLMEAAGFKIKVHDTGNTAIRKGVGMPDRLASCHTAYFGGYAFEGHVPPRDIKRLLRERPKGVGLAVPGMPIGSAGMDGPAFGGRRDPYDVLLVQRDGSTSVFQSYR